LKFRKKRKKWNKKKEKFTSSKEEKDEKNEKEPEIKRPKVSKDVEEGRTLFIRNLSFDTSDDAFRECFAKFGPLKYALICKYADTDHSKGSGFVQFFNKTDTDACLEAAGLAAGLTLDKRKLIVSRAISRDDAKEIERKRSEKTPKDRRNLHLLRIGLIRAGTKEAKEMSESDAEKRLRIEAANRQKIKNLSIFVSPNRICVHNVPKRIRDAELKTICYANCQMPGAKITECRIMRNFGEISAADGTAKSLGFAFVSFVEHEQALACLKSMNNNPKNFWRNQTSNRRIFVGKS